jgi:hypothetical protein
MFIGCRCEAIVDIATGRRAGNIDAMSYRPAYLVVGNSINHTRPVLYSPGRRRAQRFITLIVNEFHACV